MRCPFCFHNETKVVDSRLVGEGDQIRRRRECLGCTERFTTFETIELDLPRVIKRDNVREPFDEQKIRSGLMRALEKRPVSIDDIEQAISKIRHKLRARGEREIHSHLLGDWVMDILRELDDVAYVRFASVYRDFQDVSAFEQEIQKLTEKK